MAALAPSRRAVLQVGCSAALGLELPAVLAGAARAPAAQRTRAKSVVLIWLSGGLSQLDTFDLKPDAPDDIRGPFRPVATPVPGVQVSEHLPLLAARAKRYALLRTLSHKTPIHEHATGMMLTGVDAPPPGSTDRASRNDWPHYAAGVDYVRPRTDGVPNGVLLPLVLNNGPVWAGQTAGLLGAKHDPLQLGQNTKQSPRDLTFRINDLGLTANLTPQALADRMSLLGDLDRARAAPPGTDPLKEYGDRRRQAADMLAGSRVAGAFDLDQEPVRVRDRYGRNLFGQSLLLARRLVAAGVPLVQANMGAFNTWDTHYNNCRDLKRQLLPPLDQAVSAFLDDLGTRGMLDDTLVVLTSEFGRTPRMGLERGGVNETPNDSRDHWAGAFSALVAGAGVVGGQVVGRSDKIGAYPATVAHHPSDLGATVYGALGIDADREVTDRLGRPLRLNAGKAISALFDGTGD